MKIKSLLIIFLGTVWAYTSYGQHMKVFTVKSVNMCMLVPEDFEIEVENSGEGEFYDFFAKEFSLGVAVNHKEEISEVLFESYLLEGNYINKDDNFDVIYASGLYEETKDVTFGWISDIYSKVKKNSKISYRLGMVNFTDTNIAMLNTMLNSIVMLSDKEFKRFTEQTAEQQKKELEKRVDKLDKTNDGLADYTILTLLKSVKELKYYDDIDIEVINLLTLSVQPFISGLYK